MSVLPAFEHRRPADLEEALASVSAEDVPYAGGTELLVAMRAGLLRPRSIVDLKRVEELGVIGADGDAISIGGSVTHHRASRDAHLLRAFPVLGEVLPRVGNPRVRAVGTLGGNLCFAEPKSDVATVLVALGAEVVLRSRDGARAVPVEDFMVGPYTTVREDEELLTEIRLPRRDDLVAVYEKFQTMERPTVGVAACAAPGGTRLVVGAVGGAPMTFTAGSPSGLDPGEIASAVEVIPDLTGSARYKRHLTRVVAERALRRLEEAA